MALDMTTGELLDPFKGLDDLVHGVLMTPSTPELSFSDDPLRMMRAARFTAQLDSAGRPVQAMTDMAERITIVSPNGCTTNGQDDHGALPAVGARSAGSHRAR